MSFCREQNASFLAVRVFFVFVFFNGHKAMRNKVIIISEIQRLVICLGSFP